VNYSFISGILSFFIKNKNFLLNIWVWFYENYYLKWYKKENYYYKECTKHVTVFKNGHSIVINTSLVRILIPEKSKQITRKITLEDAKKGVAFKDLEVLLNQKVEKRFDDYILWVVSDSHKNINLVQKVDGETKENGKVLDLKFIVDNRVYKKFNKDANFSFAFSVPGMYPIIEGFKDHNNIFKKDFKYTSSTCIDKRIKKFTFILSFEKGILVESNPYLAIFILDKDYDDNIIYHKIDEKSFESIDDLFYDKYVYTVKNPKIMHVYESTWEVKSNNKNKMEEVI
jgi:hypothetical protein